MRHLGPPRRPHDAPLPRKLHGCLLGPGGAVVAGAAAAGAAAAGLAVIRQLTAEFDTAVGTAADLRKLAATYGQSTMEGDSALSSFTETVDLKIDQKTGKYDRNELSP